MRVRVGGTELFNMMVCSLSAVNSCAAFTKAYLIDLNSCFCYIHLVRKTTTPAGLGRA
jgi:hypothetical protein